MALAPPDLEALLSPSEAARRLGRSYGRVKQLIDAGQLRAVRTALGYLIEPAALEEYAARQRHQQPLPGAEVRGHVAL